MTEPDKDEVLRQLAYQSWLDRGQPIGSPEVDWEYACNLLRASPTARVTPSLSRRRVIKDAGVETPSKTAAMPRTKARATKKTTPLNGATPH